MAVLGLEKATRTIQNDDVIIVDGKQGVVIVNPRERTLFEFEELKQRYEDQKALIARSGRIPAETKDGIRMEVMGNIELPEEVVQPDLYLVAPWPFSAPRAGFRVRRIQKSSTRLNTSDTVIFSPSNPNRSTAPRRSDTWRSDAFFTSPTARAVSSTLLGGAAS